MSEFVNGIHHIGYLVKNIKKSMEKFHNLGYRVMKDAYYDELRQADICFMEMDNYVIELVSPNEKSDIYPLLKKYKNAPYHICYRTDSMEQAIEQLKHSGFMQIKPIEPAKAISSTAKVVFMTNRNAGMIELVEE